MSTDKNSVIKTFGRRRSRGLSDLQKNSLQLYEKYGIRDFDNLFFDRKFEKLFFEIGFGMGEHLVQIAIQNPEVAIIGCEPFENGVANALRGIEENHLTNVKIFNDDARLLLNSLPDESIDRFFVLFPDPWRKKRHHKRRLLTCDFIKFLTQKLKNDGDLIIASDFENYMDEILENAKQVKEISLVNVSLERPADFIATKYERKAIESGRTPRYARFLKSSSS